MPTPKRPRDPIARAVHVMEMLVGDRPNDKDQVLSEQPEQEQPTGHAKAAKARVASQTPERRREVARKAAAARWAK